METASSTEEGEEEDEIVALIQVRLLLARPPDRLHRVGTVRVDPTFMRDKWRPTRTYGWIHTSTAPETHPDSRRDPVVFTSPRGGDLPEMHAPG